MKRELRALIYHISGVCLVPTFWGIVFRRYGIAAVGLPLAVFGLGLLAFAETIDEREMLK